MTNVHAHSVPAKFLSAVTSECKEVGSGGYWGISTWGGGGGVVEEIGYRSMLIYQHDHGSVDL